MLKRLVVFIGMGFLLTGCVLQSHQPLFSEADGALLPTTFSAELVTENLVDTGWKREEGALTLTPSGHHYVAIDEKKKDATEVLFVPLDKNWWVMQATNPEDKSAIYVLAEQSGDMLLLRPLFCADLKKQPVAAAEISFEGDDCYLKGGQGASYFKAMIAGAEPAKMRLVRGN